MTRICSHRADWPQFAFGGAIALGAAAMGLVALAMPPRVQDILLGPRLFPLLVMGGLMALGAGLMLSSWRGGKAQVAAHVQGAPSAPGGDLPSPAEAGFAKAGAALTEMIGAPSAPGGEAALTQMIGAPSAPGAPPPIDDWRGVALVALALLLFALLVETAGFVVAECALFAVTASAFGSRRRWRDVGVGLVLAGAAYVVFKHGLGLNLPVGSAAGYFLAAWGGP